MIKNFIILTDTRQQKENHILKEFDKLGILHLRTTLPSADYMALRYDEKNGMFLDYSILIDTKKDLEEIAGNLCNTTNHERILREIARGKELGAKEFIFLIADNKIKNAEDLQNWSSKRTKVKGLTLAKIFKTMSQRYNIRFIICKKQDLGKNIAKILQKN